MKSVKIVPEICKGEIPKWSGHVLIKVPNFDEKYEIYEILAGDIEDGEKSKRKGELRAMREAVKLSKKLYLEVDLKSVNEVHVKSFDEMYEEDELHPVLLEIATMMIQGFKVGNG